jgi:transcription factor IIIB subunit 2
LSDVDDEEIEAMILTEEEVALKTRIWYHSNKEYLEEMAVRRMVEKDKGINPQSRKGKKHKKKMAPATTPAEAAKQLLEKKKMSKKINQAVFDDMFESPESIAKIKARDAIQRITGSPITNANTVDYEVVEESGDITTASSTKKTDVTGTAAASDQPAAAAAEEEEEEDDEEMDSDDMADDERFLRDARANYNLNEDDDVPDYGDDYDDDY